MLYTYEPSGKTVTRTFRLDQKWDLILEKEAERRHISVSALLNQMVLKFVFTDRHYVEGIAITLPSRTFASLIERMREEDVAELGYNTGLTIPEDRFLMRGVPPDYKSVIWFIEVILDKYNGLFQCVHHETRDRAFLHLRHGFGENWSHFLSNYMVALFKSVLDLDVRTELREDSVTVYIREKAITKKQG
jgi:hypothetical protein